MIYDSEINSDKSVEDEEQRVRDKATCREARRDQKPLRSSRHTTGPAMGPWNQG